MSHGSSSDEPLVRLQMFDPLYSRPYVSEEVSRDLQRMTEAADNAQLCMGNLKIVRGGIKECYFYFAAENLIIHMQFLLICIFINF